MRQFCPRQLLTLAALWPIFTLAAHPTPSELGEGKLFRIIKSNELGPKAKGVWRNMELDFEVGADVNFDQLGVWAQYQYRLDHSFKQGEYIRTDEWRLKKSLKVGNIINKVNTPLLFDLTKNLGIQFIRQFKNRREAMTAAPYHVKHLPLTSELAISRLQPGDFIAIPSVLTLFLGYNHRATHGVIESTTRRAYFVRGTFLLHFYRMSRERMRVKIFPTEEGAWRAVCGSGLVMRCLRLICWIKVSVEFLMTISFRFYSIERWEMLLLMTTFLT